MFAVRVPDSPACAEGSVALDAALQMARRQRGRLLKAVALIRVRAEKRMRDVRGAGTSIHAWTRQAWEPLLRRDTSASSSAIRRWSGVLSESISSRV